MVCYFKKNKGYKRKPKKQIKQGQIIRAKANRSQKLRKEIRETKNS